jgi:winged helix DNA-binding protein
LKVTRDQVVRYRQRVTHLDQKLPPGSFAQAAWGGLQDTIPRGGVTSLHARVEGAQPDSWEDPQVVQIWFRGGADYIVPRADVGIFTLGSLPRDPARVAELEQLADDVHRVAEGQTLLVREVAARLKHPTPIALRFSALTGRTHIRWDASNIWLIPVARPGIEPEDARLELARRFLHWLGPATKAGMGRWTGVSPRDASATWKSIEGELVAVDVGGERRYMLANDRDALQKAEPIQGVRLLPMDDPLTKTDKELLVPNEEWRAQVLPAWGQSPGYLPGAVLVDGEIVGVWQRQQRKVRVRLFADLRAGVREAIEAEALSMPIAGKSDLSIAWET